MSDGVKEPRFKPRLAWHAPIESLKLNDARLQQQNQLPVHTDGKINK